MWYGSKASLVAVNVEETPPPPPSFLPFLLLSSPLLVKWRVFLQSTRKEQQEQSKKSSLSPWRLEQGQMIMLMMMKREKKRWIRDIGKRQKRTCLLLPPDRIFCVNEEDNILKKSTRVVQFGRCWTCSKISLETCVIQNFLLFH